MLSRTASRRRGSHCSGSRVIVMLAGVTQKAHLLLGNSCSIDANDLDGFGQYLKQIMTYVIFKHLAYKRRSRTWKVSENRNENNRKMSIRYENNSTSTRYHEAEKLGGSEGVKKNLWKKRKSWPLSHRQRTRAPRPCVCIVRALS